MQSIASAGLHPRTSPQCPSGKTTRSALVPERDVVERAIAVLLLASVAATSGCVLALPVGGIAAASVGPAPRRPPIAAESVAIGTLVRWQAEDASTGAREVARLKERRDAAWIVARGDNGDTTLVLARTVGLEVSLSSHASRSRAFWHPFIWGTIGYFAGGLIGTAADRHPSRDLSEEQAYGLLYGGIGGIAFGTWYGLRRVPQWTGVQIAAR